MHSLDFMDSLAETKFADDLSFDLEFEEPLSESATINSEDLEQSTAHTAPDSESSASKDATSLLKQILGDKLAGVNLGAEYALVNDPLEVTLTGNHNFLIIPDCHFWDKNFTGRTNYVDECWETADNLLTYVRKDERITDVIFAGDIFHKGFSGLETFRPWVEYFSRLKGIVNGRGGELYAVIGNHEYSYSKNNPFWTLKGVFLKTPEKIHCNGKLIYLDSYPSGKGDRAAVDCVHADICVTHTEVIEPLVKADIEAETKRDMFVTHSHFGFSRFDVDYLFCGHLHLANNTYVNINDHNPDIKTVVQYLGTLGRTNYVEVRDDALDVCVPLIFVKEDEIKIEQKVIRLRDFASSVIPEAILTAKIQREARKELLQVKNEILVEDPFGKLVERYKDSPIVVDVLKALADNRMPQVLKDVLDQAELFY